MKVLILNYAKQLFEDKDRAIGDERDRIIEYGQHLEKLFIVVSTLKKFQYHPVELSDSVTVIPSNGWNRTSSFYNMLKIGSYLCSQCKIDIVNVQEPYYTGVVGCYLKKKYGIKLITAVLGSNVYDNYWKNENKFRHILGIIGKFVLKYSDFLQVDGSKTESELIERGIPRKKIFKKVIVPGGLDGFCHRQKKDIRRKISGGKFEKILLFVGRLEKQKNLKGLLSIMPDILKSNSNVLLLVIGDGREKTRLEKLVEKLRMERNILFLGNVPFSDLSDYYVASDVFLLPSDYEGFARSLMLAAICGKAIVSTDVSGASDLILNEESGFIVEVGNMESFRDKVMELLCDEEKLEIFGENVKKNARKLLSCDRMVESQIKFWRDVCLSNG